jgi:hypothetical protein
MTRRSILMISVTHIEQAMQDLFGAKTDQLAKDLHVVQRQRTLTGSSFAHTVIFGWLANPDATLDELSQLARANAVTITGSGLSQRFTQDAAQFFHELLHWASQLCLRAEPVEVALLRRFSAVIVEDSTTITLPDALLDVWRGCGGSGSASASAVKVHVRFDLLSGAIVGLRLSDARVSDNATPFRQEADEGGTLPAGCLYLADLGYFSLLWLQQMGQRQGHSQKRMALMRLKQGTALLTRSRHRLNLHGLLPQQVGQVVEIGVLLGVQARLPVRLILVRVPEEVVDQRRERLQAEAEDRGETVSQEQWFLAQWTLLLTTAPRRLLAWENLYVLLRHRWQIELLFKLWKQHGKIDEWRSKNRWRILCECYGKLIAMLVQQWLLTSGCWHDPFRSLVKAAQVVRRCAFSLCVTRQGQGTVAQVLATMHAMMAAGCRVNTRATHPSAAQLLFSGSEWTLT